MSEHELWNELGNLYFMSGAYNQATHAYHRSIQLENDFGRPYSNLALTYVQQGKYEEAIELYRRSIELLAEDSEKAISWNRLGNVYRHLKDYEQALIAFQKADDLDPESNETREEPGQLLYTTTEAPEFRKIDEMTDASTAPETEENTVTASLPDEDPVSSDLDESEPAFDETTASWTPADPSDFQQDISDSPEAEDVSLTTWVDANPDEEFEPNLDFEPESADFTFEPDDDDRSIWLPLPEAELGKNESLQLPGEEQEDSEPAKSQGISLEWTPEPADPEPDPSPRTLPTLEERVEEPARQIEVEVQERPPANFVLSMEEKEEEKKKEKEPQSAEVDEDEKVEADVNTPAIDQQEMQEIEIEIEKFKRVVQINPRNAYAWDALGTLYKSAGLYKDAILAYQQAITTDSSKAVYHHHLGLVYACDGRDEDAIAAFQQVIEIDPEYSLAHATLGGYYRKMGLEDLAQKHIGKAMKNIFDSENEYNRACLEAICGNADQAIDLLRVALKNKQTYVDWILRDPDLDFIRQDPRFKQLISEYTR